MYIAMQGHDFHFELENVARLFLPQESIRHGAPEAMPASGLAAYTLLERRAEDSVAATAKAIAAAVARELVETFAYAILYILIFVALVLLLRLAALAINLVLRLPVLSGVNTLGGALLGLLEGMMVVWLLIWLLPHFGIELPTEETYLLRFFTAVGPLSLLSSL